MDATITAQQLSLPQFTSLSEPERIAGLHRQHTAFSRLGYDGHNRRPIESSMKHLGHRRRRRRTRAHLRLAWLTAA